VGEGHFIVSITLDPKFRGTGRAKSLLKLAIKRTDARIIEALIREENEKSRRLFASCGFNKVGQVDDHGFSLYRKSGRADD
jgi:RimJ/RimL family protein N-acetyltransferase